LSLRELSKGSRGLGGKKQRKGRMLELKMLLSKSWEREISLERETGKACTSGKQRSGQSNPEEKGETLKGKKKKEQP